MTGASFAHLLGQYCFSYVVTNKFEIALGRLISRFIENENPYWLAKS